MVSGLLQKALKISNLFICRFSFLAPDIRGFFLAILKIFMEKIKTFFHALKLWQVLLLTGLSITLLVAVIFASQYLQHSAKIKLGSSDGLILSADRQDSLGTFSDSAFTLKSDKDLSTSDIKNNLTFFPEVDFGIREINSRQFSIQPKAKLVDNSLYRVRVSSDKKTFSWAFQIKNNFRVVQTLPADKSTNVPVNSGIEISFSHDNYENIDRNFEITPSVDGRFERHKRTTSFVPKSLSPDTLYTVKLKKGLKLKGTDEVLKEDFIFRFETQSANAQSRANFSRDFYEFSTSETPAFDIYTGQASGGEVSVKVYQYPSSQNFLTDFTTKLAYPAWASNSRYKDKLAVSGLNKVLDFKSPVQQQKYVSYFLLPQSLPKGFYLVEVSIDKIVTQALVQITDLSAYITVSGTKTLVWVNDTGTGKAVSGAKISYAGIQQTTSSDGTAYFDTPTSEIIEPQSVLSIQQGTSSLLLPAQSSNYYESSYQKTRRQSDKYWSYFYADRPLYLPTDTVKFWGLLRNRDNLGQKQKFTVEVTKSDYTSWDFTPITLFQKDFETSDLGTFIGEIPLNQYTPGWYSISAKVGGETVLSSSFSVETYTKPAYSLSLNSSKKAVIVGDSVTFSGQASFFEGSPVPNMDLKRTSPDVIKLTTDALGKFSFSYTPSPSDVSTNYTPNYKYFSIMPLRPEEGAEQADSSISVFNSSLVFGTSKTSSKNNVGKVEVDLRLVDVDKFTSSPVSEIFSPAPSQNISGVLYENEWVRRETGTYYDFINKTTTPSYEYNFFEKRLTDVSLSTGPDGKAFYEFATTPEKSYRLALQATDSLGRTTGQDSYIYGTSGSYLTSDYFHLKPEKTGVDSQSYAVGEQVNLALWQGNTAVTATPTDKFLYLYAQRGLKSYQVSASPQTGFKYSEAFVPNVYVKAVRFTGKTYQVSENVYLNFDTTSKKLSLSLSTDKQSYLPGDTAKVQVQVKNPNGNGVESEVNLNFIDAAYDAMSPRYTNPLSDIYKTLGSDILVSYSSHKYPLDITGAEGGGCFLPGTQVLLGSGKTKAIESIKVGDTIKTLQSPTSSKLTSAKVTKVFTHQVAGYLLLNNHLRVTGEHNLYINGRWMTASEAKVGDFYLDESGQYQSIFSIESFSGLNTVYNFTVDKLGTYFADGFYVHNEKGRELFVDNAFFGSIKTGTDGKGSVQVKLPDNLTSWHITSQALTKDLSAGHGTSDLVVKQPFFVDTVMNTEYLTGERPQILVRAYGEGLSGSDSVSLNVESSTLGLNKTLTLKAFESVKVDLGELKSGDHKLSFTGKSGNLSDKVIRSISVIDSRLKSTKSVGTSLALGTKPVGSDTVPTRLVFSDQNSGRFYPPLNNLASTWGDRLDQRLVRSLAQEQIKKSFDDTTTVEKLDFAPYTAQEGGYTLFPYSSPDLETSVFIAALAKDKVSQAGLSNYLYQQLSSAKDSETASLALFGLASLDQPVLNIINSLSGEKSKTPLTRIYLSLAQAKIGDTEKAHLSYSQILSDYSKKKDNFTYIAVPGDKDDILRATALTAALASLLGDSHADSLLAYTLANSGKDLLLISPQLLAITHQLQNTKPSPVSFTYTLGDKKTSVKLEKGEVYKLQLSPKDIGDITFQDITGSVGLTSVFATPLDAKTAQLDPSVKITRTYSVGGKVTNAFSSTDVVKVSLPFTHGVLSQDGCYQVSDLLPSGLKPITSVYSYGLETQDIWYPYEINGQKVSFCVGKDIKTSSINYYARVISAGDYKAENALIQSLLSPSVFNLSPAGNVNIK